MHTAATTSVVHDAVPAALSMSPGIAAKRVASHLSQTQRSVRASGIQKPGNEHSTLQASAHAASRGSGLPADAGGTGSG